MPPMTGRVIAGRYALSSPIGRGAMGVVWRARDQLLDREVAVKEVVLSAAIGEDERRNAYQRTLREARTAARLSHRGVVTVFDVAEEDGRPWIIMELVPSRSLDELLITDGPMTALRAGRMGQQLLAALAAAHTVGVLHRDVKPSNVLIATDRSGDGWDERAVLTDFGIAQFEGDPRLTATGMVMGSPGFTAPERIRGGDATPASDLWSLGATIYTAVEGRGPYDQRGGAITTMSAIINEDAPVAPSAGRLAPLIAALLRREPSARPSAAAAARLFAEVLPLLSGVSAHPATVRSTYTPGPAQSAAPAAPAASAAPVAPAVASPAPVPAPAAAAPAPAAAGSAAEAGGDVAASHAAAVKAAVADASAVGVAAAVGAAAGLGAAGAGSAAGDQGAAPADHAEPVKVEAPAAALPDASSPGSAAPPAGVASALDGDVKPRGSVSAPPAESRLPTAPPPTERSLPLPPAAPLQPKPTFTASKSNERAAPPLDRPRSAQPVPPQPAPSFSASRSARPADPPTTPEPAYESPQYSGSNAPYTPNAPYASSGGQYGSAGAQYAGPSAQAYSDPSRQYAPGTGRRTRRRRRGRARWLAAAALVVAAAAGGGAAYALHNHKNSTTVGTTANTGPPKGTAASVVVFDSPTTTVPANWTSMSVQPSGTATTAGFTIDVPPGWTESRSGLRTYFYAPDGVRFLEVDLTPHTYPNMLTEARYIATTSVAKGKFPHYRQVRLDSESVRGTAGAFWAFTFIPAGSATVIRSDDILYIARTPAGQQSYAIYFRGLNKGWNSLWLGTFEQMLKTFQTLPA